MNDPKKFIKSVEDLDVFEKAYQLSLAMHKFSLHLPQVEQFALGDQIRRASKSICANIAEGFAKQRQSAPEFRRFLSMAIGSSDEMKVWLRYCKDLGYTSQDQAKQWRASYSEIAKMLNGLMENWKSKAGKNTQGF